MATNINSTPINKLPSYNQIADNQEDEGVIDDILDQINDSNQQNEEWNPMETQRQQDFIRQQQMMNQQVQQVPQQFIHQQTVPQQMTIQNNPNSVIPQNLYEIEDLRLTSIVFLSVLLVQLFKLDKYVNNYISFSNFTYWDIVLVSILSSLLFIIIKKFMKY